jgi:hypothetical protein
MHQNPFTSLRDAYETYYWPTNSLVPVTGEATDEAGDDEEEGEELAAITFDRESNSTRLAELRGLITKGLNDSNAERTFIAAMKILDWGQVYKGSVGWLIQKHENNALVTDVKRAVAILDGDQLSATDAFGAMGLRMDSGLTKVYSLASKHSIIYDDRVGAALGLIVIQFLKAYPEHQHKAKKDKVPEELKFMRSATASRNPSCAAEGFKLPSKRGGALHAQSNLMANWIMYRIAGELPILWDKHDVTDKLRAMESAFFMLGYRVAQAPA